MVSPNFGTPEFRLSIASIRFQLIARLSVALACMPTGLKKIKETLPAHLTARDPKNGLKGRIIVQINFIYEHRSMGKIYRCNRCLYFRLSVYQVSNMSRQNYYLRYSKFARKINSEKEVLDCKNRISKISSIFRQFCYKN